MPWHKAFFVCFSVYKRRTTLSRFAPPFHKIILTYNIMYDTVYSQVGFLAVKDMEKKRVDIIKKILTAILILLVGIAFTVASFCIYYIVKPQNAFVLAALCIVDFAYCYFSVCMFIKYESVINKWLLVGFLLAVGYIVAFISVVAIIAVFGSAFSSASFEFLKNNILGIVFYAFFTAPCALIIVPAFLIGLGYGA